MNKIQELKKLAAEIRIETIRMIGHLGFGHIGGALSIADTLAVLYGEVMRYDVKNPKWADRDWLVCSKGHGGPAIYSSLAIKGFFPKEELLTLNTPGTHLPSHCDRNLTTGIDMTTGSLGQGSSLAVGVALGNRLSGRNSYTYLILGDGELQEGQIWEAVMFSAQKKLDNLIAFVDYNKKQLDGYTKDINDLGDVKAKFESFGWHGQEVDGSDVEQIINAIENAKAAKGQPSVIVLHTVKGKGAAFVENELSNHHMVVSKEKAEEAIKILQEELESMTINNCHVLQSNAEGMTIDNCHAL
ncbi:transketolase [Clostridium swellfunianum]|uniref:transketolase n=1 Tax=Clostridium swellfunianum TaxID=1367462 RepID=UPI00202ED3AF|nr:transketolase [Clostridium swellfunianum]MCM0650824.1 transketolase [Clostridium swellfunianum]